MPGSLQGIFRIPCVQVDTGDCAELYIGKISLFLFRGQFQGFPEGSVSLLSLSLFHQGFAEHPEGELPASPVGEHFEDGVNPYNTTFSTPSWRE